MMRFLGVVVATAVLSGSAAASEFERNILIGAGLGAGVGALIGSATGGPAGAAVGAAMAASAGVIVFLIRPDGCFIRNRRGELWQVPVAVEPFGRRPASVGNEIGGLRLSPARPDCRISDAPS